MGNQLVGIAPQQIYPVEHYIQDLPDQISLTFQASLGSTRFFKVAKCDSEAGPVVVKVFVIHDPNQNIRPHQERLLELTRLLAPTFNCLPFSQAVLTDKAGFIIRQYGKYSLYDRLSTRPFLGEVEKKWLSFQLLLAVDQIHQLGVCHGDIKLENILVTSWSWLQLTDFAAFKPTLLPEDNPADYSYFFDTSRRRVCYIAPERFVSRVGGVESSGYGVLVTSETGGETGETGPSLLPAMDVFSVGCCIGELFADGAPVFDFSQLLAYRAGEHQPVEALARLENQAVREMVEQMISREPGTRLTVGEHLQQQRGKVFPESFYSFLQSYVGMFSRSGESSDQKIVRLERELPRLESLLASGECEAGSLLVVTGLVTSCVRSLQLASSQLACLAVLQWLPARLPAPDLLERILPQLIYFLGSGVASVAARAVHALLASLTGVKTVPRSDANTFPEYILPALAPLCHSEHVSVRCALASHLASIARLSTDWLELGSHNTPASQDYQTELAALHSSLVGMVTSLLEDSSNAVKQVVVSSGAARLAVWLGRQRANDVLLSHMITFLNDKEDAQLRHCFYENIAGVASYVGWQASPILVPLLEQGLADTEEMVVQRALTATADLARQGLLERAAMFEMTQAAVPFLLHPNLWLRQATAGLVAAAAARIDMVDVQVKLGSLVAPFLKQNLIQVRLLDLYKSDDIAIL